MQELETKEEDLTRLVQLSFKMFHIGFDELPMDERVEFVSLFGATLGHQCERLNNVLSLLEDKVE